MQEKQTPSTSCESVMDLAEKLQAQLRNLGLKVQLNKLSEALSRVAGYKSYRALRAIRPAQPCAHAHSDPKQAAVLAFAERVAELRIWGEPIDESGTPFEPADGLEDSHNCLMDLIEEARSIMGHSPLGTSAAPTGQQLFEGPWSHIFFASVRAQDVWLVIDPQAADIRSMQLREGSGWVEATQEQILDVRESLREANDQVLDNPRSHGFRPVQESALRVSKHAGSPVFEHQLDVYVRVVSRASDLEDAGVEGVYLVHTCLLDEREVTVQDLPDLRLSQQHALARAALDEFHDSIGIECLEDFDIRLFLSDGRRIQEHEAEADEADRYVRVSAAFGGCVEVNSGLRLELLRSLLRQDVIDSMVEDVRERAQNFEFSLGGFGRARDLAAQSAEALGLSAWEAELDAAARDLIG